MLRFVINRLFIHKSVLCIGSFQELLTAGRDLLADWLDAQHGHEISDKSIFSGLTQHWENEFHNDMQALNVSMEKREDFWVVVFMLLMY